MSNTTKTATIEGIPEAWANIDALPGIYEGFACSEADPFNPTRPIIFYVPLTGGPVTADVLGEQPRGDAGNATGDPWTYDVATGISCTGYEVALLQGETV